MNLVSATNFQQGGILQPVELTELQSVSNMKADINTYITHNV